MPRVEVLIQVVDDAGTNQTRSSFQVRDEILQLLGPLNSPFRLVAELGELFRDTILREYSALRSLMPGDIPVTSSAGNPIQRRVVPPLGSQPSTPIDSETAQRMVTRFREAYPVLIPVPPDMNYPEISMGAGVGAASRTEEYPLNLVDTTLEEQGFYEYRLASREILLQRFGLPDTTTQEELDEALRVASRVRGQRTLGVIYDDDAYFGQDFPEDTPPLHTQGLGIIRRVYEGDQVRSYPPKDPPPTSTPILTRYQRKPVI